MAIEFVIAFRPGPVRLSIPATDYSPIAELASPLGVQDLASDISPMKQLTAALRREARRRNSSRTLAMELFGRSWIWSWG